MLEQSRIWSDQYTLINAAEQYNTAIFVPKIYFCAFFVDMGNQHTKLTDEELSMLVSDPRIKCETQKICVIMTDYNSVNEREILEFWDGWRYDMQLLNPAMDAKEIKSTGLSKYAFIRTYVQACLMVALSSMLTSQRHLVRIILKIHRSDTIYKPCIAVPSWRPGTICRVYF